MLEHIHNTRSARIGGAIIEMGRSHFGKRYMDLQRPQSSTHGIVDISSRKNVVDVGGHTFVPAIVNVRAGRKAAEIGVPHFVSNVSNCDVWREQGIGIARSEEHT